MADHPADLTFAILRFATVSREHPHYHLPAFIAGYLCAALDVSVDLRFGRCGTHQDSFRVGHREGAAALAIYKRRATDG